MNFIKMHGIGNDFVILDHRRREETLSTEIIKKISHRHFGVGCDQLIVMEPSEKADVFMRIYNADGSQAQSCGNATRCIAAIIMTEEGADSCVIETLKGVLPCRRVDDGWVEVDMGKPGAIKDLDISISELNEPVAVDMGNPHCVFFVDDAEAVNITNFGPAVERHTLFPERTNVEFAQIMTDGRIRLRVWERGCGVTLACGSGACATVVAAAHRGLTDRRADVIMDGGHLIVEYRENDSHVLMTGPVAYVFSGEWLG